MSEATLKKLGWVDKLLTLWIFMAMGLGLTLGYLYPALHEVMAKFQVGSLSIPIAVGLILMMYPPFVKVNYNKIGSAFGRKRLFALSAIQNWVIGPVFMAVLAVVFLRDYPGYMVGVILVGLARCIAMVVVWNDLAKGDRELGVGLVALNAIFQVLFYAAYIFLFITIILSSLGILQGQNFQISFMDTAQTVLFFLGIPFAAGFLTRYLVIRLKGKEWLEQVFIKAISPMTLIALLFTIIIMFALKGKIILETPLDVLRIAIPYCIYFFTMWFSTFLIAKRMGSTHEQSTALSFSAASNDFELAIAVSIALFGINSNEALATVIGPLIEVPVMVILVKISQKFRGK